MLAALSFSTSRKVALSLFIVLALSTIRYPFLVAFGVFLCVSLQGMEHRFYSSTILVQVLKAVTGSNYKCVSLQS